MKTYADTRHERIAAANRAALALLDAYAEAIGEYPTEDDPETRAAYAVSHTENMTLVSTYATASDYEMIAAMVEAIADRAREEEPAPAPIYQRHELEAFLGEPDDYDMDAIEAEATEYDPKTGRTVWAAFGDDLAAIAERHELYSYAPAI